MDVTPFLDDYLNSNGSKDALFNRVVFLSKLSKSSKYMLYKDHV